MNFLFRKLPLLYKMMLIGIIPVFFLVYLSSQLYKEKKQRVNLIADYIEHIHQSSNIAALINELESERRYSYEYALKKDNYGKLIEQRPRTDAVIKRLQKSNDPGIKDFTQYTFLNKLSMERLSVDTAVSYPTNKVMEYYTNTIYRLNTLNTVPSASNVYLQPVISDFIAERKLFEMSVFLGIIRTNIYNALYTKQNMTATLLGSLGLYDLFNTYEAEFLLKASPGAVKIYNDKKNEPALKQTLNYVSNVFNNLKSDSSITADRWWAISSEAKNILTRQQIALWGRAEAGTEQIYKQEVESKNKTLVFLITAIILVISFVIYTTRIVSQMLTELKVAAEKISIGGTQIRFRHMPDDAMGSLAQSILNIDRNNIELAYAASAIGSGNFEVLVKPRSKQDLLGNSIEKMKEDLHQLTKEKDKVQQETLELMNRKDDFLSIASHELKTPVTSLKAYAQLLQMGSKGMEDRKRELMISKMEAQIDKLTALITDLLDTSKMQNGKLFYNKTFFNLKDLVDETMDEMQATVTTHEINASGNTFLPVYADKDRIGQVLNNFLNNAIKYCPDCKKIIVDVENKNGMAVCSVKDFGNGIIKDQQDKVFERFYRVTGKNLHTYPGLGLGLFIAKEIIERHSGKIWVESEPGNGSIFYFSLPLAEN
jgi:signal transduction histidine kinase